MKKLTLVITVLLAFAFMFAGCSSAGKLGLMDDTLLVGVDDTYPPMEYVDENGDLVGFDVEFAKALAAEMGVDIKFVSTGWDGIFANLAAKQYDVIISSVSMTEERMETMAFSTPYLSNGQVIVANPDMVDTINTPEDLDGLIVGVQAETTADNAAVKLLDEGTVSFDLKDFDDMTVCLAAMEAGQIDCIVADYVVAIEAASKNPEVFVITSALLTNEPIAVAMNKDNEELIEAVNKAIATLQDNGKMKQISEETLGADYTSNIDTELR
jgi:polar amino acid transport system substrate-binding protein